MVLGCILWKGVVYAVRIDGRIDGELYVKILEDDLKKSLKWYKLKT